jgi:hypothetical protein
MEDSVDVLAYGSNGSYLWSNLETTNGITEFNQGSYWFEVVDSNGCSANSDTLTIENYDPLSTIVSWSNPDTGSSGNVSLYNHDTITTCFGDSVILSSTNDAVTTIWSSGDTSSTLNITQSGNYFASTLSLNGCHGHTDTVYIIVKAALPDSILTSPIVTNCPGDSVSLSIAQGVDLSYLWNTGESTNQISVNTDGYYSATITNDYGCTVVTDSMEYITHNVNDTIWAVSQIIFCEGDSVLLELASNSNYTWNTTDSTKSIAVKQMGSYWAQITDSNGCSLITDTISVSVNPLPMESISILGSSTFCENDSAILLFSGQNSYSWSTGDSLDQIPIYTSGSYFATITDSNGCVNNSDTILAIVNEIPSDSIVLSGNTEFCDGDSVIISALPFNTYSWNTGDTTSQVSIYSSSLVTGVVTDVNGCSRQLDTAFVVVNPLPLDSIYTQGQTTFCQGDSVVVNSADATSAYLWNTSATTQNVVATSSGPYYVGLITNKGCIAVSDTIDVVVNPNPNGNISINGSLDLCLGDSVELSANTGLSYNWSTGDSTESITIGQTGNFTVDVTNSFGCTTTSASQNVILHGFPQTSVIIGDATGIVPLQQYNYVVTQAPGNSYNWTAVNGAVVSGQGTNIVSVMWSQDTLGSLQVIESNGYCSDTASLSIRTNIGVNEFGLGQIILYPNPTKGNVFISADEPLGEIKIYAATGAFVSAMQSMETSIQLDLSSLAAGVYWVSIGNERYRLVVMH